LKAVLQRLDGAGDERRQELGDAAGIQELGDAPDAGAVERGAVETDAEGTVDLNVEEPRVVGRCRFG
jgi:hypothetical protein